MSFKRRGVRSYAARGEQLEQRSMLAVDLLANVAPAARSANPQSITPAGDLAYFWIDAANGVSGGIELYVTDGTPHGTTPLDLSIGRREMTSAVVAGNKYFFQDGFSSRQKLYVSQGTAETTLELIQSRSRNDGPLHLLGDQVFFRALDTDIFEIRGQRVPI